MGKQLSKAERKALKRQKAQEADVLALAQGGTAVAEAEEAEETPENPPETPETSEEAPETGGSEAEAVEEKPAEGGDTPALSLADLVRSAQGISESTREKLLAEAEKIISAEAHSAQAKAMVEFNKELEATLPKWLEELRVKHGVKLDGRVIKVRFPREGEEDGSLAPKLTSSAKGNGGGGGSRESFPQRWGKAKLIKDGKTVEHDSPRKLADSLNLQVEGKRNMIDVFENPTEAKTKKELPKIYSVDADCRPSAIVDRQR